MKAFIELMTLKFIYDARSNFVFASSFYNDDFILFSGSNLV